MSALNPQQVPLSRIEIDDEVRERVMHALDAGQFILGPECKAFESELAAWFGRRHAVLCSNATAGLTLAMMSMGIGPGDEVLVPSHTAFPTIEGVFDAGAVPVFLDVDDTATLDPSWIEPRITSKTKAIVPVHIYGQPCDMDRILDVAKRRNLLVLEDCAQAHGAMHASRKVGTMGAAGVLSFYPSKNLPVPGDGGAVLTDDDGIAERVRMLRDHGRRGKHVHEVVGFNMRFNDLQAAAGRVFLRRLQANNDARRRIAARYDEALADLPLGRPRRRDGTHHVFHLYVVETPQREALAKHLASHGVQTGVHYPMPTHRQPGTLARPEVRREALPATDALVDRILSLPVFPSLTAAEQDHVIAGVRSFFGR
ncbi:MAG: DegT/DnrJ/EryC1/StrS family aminotransferase [Planctomycetes bacterium]|nr:DegT/DnrJ/EryC1/StrS family aminotransferase [Planctomycetota bacterium]